MGRRKKVEAPAAMVSCEEILSALDGKAGVSCDEGVVTGSVNAFGDSAVFEVIGEVLTDGSRVFKIKPRYGGLVTKKIIGGKSFETAEDAHSSGEIFARAYLEKVNNQRLAEQAMNIRMKHIRLCYMDIIKADCFE